MGNPGSGLKILQVNAAESGGGAARVARGLRRAYRSQGSSSWLAVGHPTGADADVLRIPNSESRNAWARFWLRFGEGRAARPGEAGVDRVIRRASRGVAEPTRWLKVLWGREDFEFPGTRRLLDLPPARPDILHAHNLHAGYFDLRALACLSRQVPAVLTLHDMWTFTGHCAHSFDCERWKSGCGRCPSLTIYPAVRRDATAFNWRRKRAVFEQCRLHVATPSKWLMDKVEESILLPAAADRRVIPNGVDPAVFSPGDRMEARKKLSLPEDQTILLYTGTGLRDGPWQDYAMLRTALTILSERDLGNKTVFLAIGEERPEDRAGNIPVRFIPFQDRPSELAEYYRAADVYVRPSKADTFPLSVLEALACGTPVAGTRVGGIPEQVRSMDDPRTEGATGVLVSPGDAEGLSAALARLLSAPSLLQRLGRNAAADARARFDLQVQARSYLDWFMTILGDRDKSVDRR